MPSPTTPDGNDCASIAKRRGKIDHRNRRNHPANEALSSDRSGRGAHRRWARRQATQRHTVSGCAAGGPRRAPEPRVGAIAHVTRTLQPGLDALSEVASSPDRRPRITIVHSARHGASSVAACYAAYLTRRQGTPNRLQEFQPVGLAGKTRHPHPRQSALAGDTGDHQGNPQDRMSR